MTENTGPRRFGSSGLYWKENGFGGQEGLDLNSASTIPQLQFWQLHLAFLYDGLLG